MKLQTHLSRNLYRIRGFMQPVDAYAFASLLDDQARRSLSGCLAEIGVFYGRSFSMLAHAAQATATKAIGIDLFDIPEQRKYVDAIIKKNRVGEATELLAQSSESVSHEDFLKAYGKTRFFHIDGGHEAHHLHADLAFARKLSSDDFIIVCDDFMNAQYPDLSAAIIDELKDLKGVVSPFLITRSKLYLCNPKHKSHYIDAVASGRLPSGVSTEKFSFLGEDLLFVSQSILARAAHEISATLGMGDTANVLPFGQKRRYTR